MTLSTTDDNRDMLAEKDAEKDAEAKADDHVVVETPTASFEGDVAAITDTHIVLADFTRWVGDEPTYGAPGQPISLSLADALPVDVMDRVA